MPEYIGAPVTTLRDALDTDLYRQHDVNVSGPYDRGWRSAGLAEEGNALADEALKAGIRGDKVERERLRGLSQARLQEAASWAPEVRTTADITDVPSALQWAAGGLGSGFRSTLPSAAGGLAGAAATLLTRGRVNPVVGGMIGGGYPAYAMEQEEAAGEALHDPRIVQRNTDSEILRASRLKGAVTALPEVALPAIVGGKVVGQGAKALIGGTPLRHIGAQTLKGGAVEGGTEYGQALVGQATQNELRGDPLTDFDQRAALEEAAIGTLVGKTLGAAGGVADVAHHKLVKPAVHAGKEIKKDPLGKVTDTIVDTIGALGTVAAKAKYGVEDYITEREARKAGMSYEELMLSRMPDISPVGKSQEQLEAELRTDDEQRMAAASVLAQRLAANPDASPALRQAAADFEQRTQQGDPTAYEALSSVLRDENTKREVREELLNNVSSWLEGKGFKLPPERRGSAMTPGEDVDAKTKQLWLKKHSHLSGAYNTTFPSDDAARISADAVFEWVKQGFPNFNAVARGLATMWGKEASLVVKDAHDYMVAEGLTQRSERLDEVLKKLDMTAGGKAQRLKMLGEMVRPSEQDKLTTMDIIVMDRLLDQFALGKIKNLGTFNEHMDRVFGKNKADVIAQYEALNQDELIEDTGTDDRRDEADADEERMAEAQSQTEDWNSGVQEKSFPTEYRGMRGANSTGYDTLYAEAQTALNDAVREARGKGEQASVVGAWDKAQRESEGDESALKNNEDDLIAKYGGLLRSAEIKRHAKEKGVEEDAAARELLSAALDDYAKVQGLPVDQVRDSMLRALNRRVRFVAVNASDKIDSVDMTNADVNALKVRYKDDSKKYGVLVFEKIAAERQVEQTDAETGEARKLAVMTPLKEPQEWTTTSRKLIGFIRKAKNLDAGESFGAAQQLEQLHAGIASLFETGMFSGRVGYRNESGGEVTWIDSKARMPADFPLAGEATVADAKKAAAEKRKGGEKEDRPGETKYAETLPERRRELSRLANRKVEEDGEERYALPAAARKEIAEALKKGEKAVNALYGRLRNQYDPALWMDKPKQSATIRSKKATRQTYDKKAYYNAKGERVDELRDGEAGTIVRRQSGFDESETNELVSEGDEMSMAGARKEDAAPRTHDELTSEPLHPAKRVEAKEVDTTQSDFVLDLLRKGMPAFNAMVNKATAEQRAKIKALIEKMLNSASDMKAKVWGKNPPKDAEQFKRRARLALKTLEEGQSKEQWTLEEMEEAKAGEKHAERVTEEEAKEEQWTLEEMEEAKAGEKHAERMTAEEAEVRPFVVLPRTSPYTAKDQAKSDKANKFIGRGSAASSTAAYAKAWGVRANSGAYEATDTVFVSVEGARTGRKVLDTEELQRALDAGATIITDDAANRGRSYNVGERTLAAYLKYHAYEEAAPGEWKPVDAQDEGDKKAQVRSLIKEGKIEEAKALSEKPQTQLREAKPGEPGSKENPHSVPMSYPASSSELRPELRKKYANIKRIAELIASGDRTGTTRTPQRGVLPGHYVTFPGVPGVYRVTGFERIDLNTPEGIARWEAREGWDREATKRRFAGQVDHGKIQMLFERAKDVAAPINIYYGAGENAHLSNLARRPFTGEDKREYRAVEHAYQAWKSGAFDAEPSNLLKQAGQAIQDFSFGDHLH